MFHDFLLSYAILLDNVTLPLGGEKVTTLLC